MLGAAYLLFGAFYPLAIQTLPNLNSTLFRFPLWTFVCALLAALSACDLGAFYRYSFFGSRSVAFISLLISGSFLASFLLASYFLFHPYFVLTLVGLLFGAWRLPQISPQFLA